ncbi:hypothetical protein SAMN06265338_102224 [Rhodoblastus acidophilus]|uniref:Uncharacterized protein n=1 Tax=Rhodoblastus acidophilus TaxID=1074 RepID=A0A212R0F2_RHOAC|nr:hypothetical protein [Rhodoblastus acidophilus]PPQ40467.1 hypothetical protein CKO16_01595 [Rhodoblastus acidophilus]RAI23049.1 hypothetical protein CH337_04235 [Rhodoblastus acidophilus]SNB65463.1 hypothetical protein SAMN06265338_102224 [Rhodoblastus acidophilus]
MTATSLGKPLGFIPSPYGTSIAVYGDRDDENSWVHDIEGCMDMAGVYGAANRAACRAAFKARAGNSITFDIFTDHGGRKVPKVALPRPRQPVYPTLPRGCDMDIPIENWITLALECSNWTTRADALIDICHSNLTHADGFTLPPEIHAIALQILLTATVEHMPDEEIDCIEAAAIYAFTNHAEWSRAGVKWLAPFNKTWFRDWVAKRPKYRTFAAAVRLVDPDLPAWIDGGGNA